MAKLSIALLGSLEARLAQGFNYFRHEVADIYSVGLNLLCVIGIGIEQRMIVQAVHLLAASEALLTGYVNVILPEERQQRADSLATGRAALGEQAFNAAWAQGQAMTMEQMLELAMEVINGE